MATAAAVTRLDFRIDARASDRSESVVHEAGLFQGRLGFTSSYPTVFGTLLSFRSVRNSINLAEGPRLAPVRKQFVGEWAGPYMSSPDKPRRETMR
jgi:hypothetical protein